MCLYLIGLFGGPARGALACLVRSGGRLGLERDVRESFSRSPSSGVRGAAVCYAMRLVATQDRLRRLRQLLRCPAAREPRLVILLVRQHVFRMGERGIVNMGPESGSTALSGASFGVVG